MKSNTNKRLAGLGFGTAPLTDPADVFAQPKTARRNHSVYEASEPECIHINVKYSWQMQGETKHRDRFVAITPGSYIFQVAQFSVSRDECRAWLNDCCFDQRAVVRNPIIMKRCHVQRFVPAMNHDFSGSASHGGGLL